MRVFVTGATGHIGSAVIPELLSAGHEVTGLARSDRSAAALETLGADVRRGDLADLDGLGRGASDSDGVIHLAFDHASMRSGDFAGAVAADLAAIQALGDALVDTGKALVSTSGTLMVAGVGRTATEEDALPSGPRVDAENFVVELADRGVRSSVVRLPPITHSPALDQHGFARVLIATARATGKSGYLGDGANRWPAGHTLDAALLYRLALEQAPAGSRLHAVDDGGIPTRDIATAIGHHLGLPTASISPDDAPEHFGFLAGLLALDNPTSSARTRALLDWQPTQPNLLTDLQDDRYFTDPTST